MRYRQQSSRPRRHFARFNEQKYLRLLMARKRPPAAGYFVESSGQIFWGTSFLYPWSQILVFDGRYLKFPVVRVSE